MAIDPRKLDPRKLSRPPQPAQPAAPPQAETRLPFQEGTVIGEVPATSAGNERLTDFERRVIEQAGAAGMPIAGLGTTAAGQRLAAQIDAVRKRAAAPSGTPGPPDRPPLAMPDIRDISTLSPAEQQEIRERIAAVQAAAAAVDARRPPDAVAGIPGMANAWGVVVEDDLQSPAADTPATAAAPAKQQPSSAVLQPEQVAAEDMPHAVTICPHCGCNTQSKAPEITAYDKAAYLGMILGGRFYKEYPLLGGHLNVTFRNRTPVEDDMIVSQLDADYKAGRVLTQPAYLAAKTTYDMLTSIARIANSAGEVTRLPAIAEMAKGPDDRTPLPNLKEWLFSEVITSDSARRIIMQTWRTYMQLLDELDAKKDIADFFSKTVPVRSSCKE